MFMDELVVRARRDSEGKHIASFVETIALGNQRVPGADPSPNPRSRYRRQHTPLRRVGQF